MDQRKTIKILGVKLDGVTYEEALQKAKDLIDSDGKHYIVTPNPELVMAAQKDTSFKKILNSADLSLPDGSGLVLLSKIVDVRLPERVTGVDFFDGLAALAENFGFSIYLLGGKEVIAKAAADQLKNRYPKLKITGASSGNPSPKFDSETREPLLGKKI
ncbi:WecB/TagA/CpsF family glycosyltransferase, partial [Patescibacteria group bacterium]|nr:WecB/TagA/CpsF family glycosyltransferase [Patescibacteria group bacterium]